MIIRLIATAIVAKKVARCALKAGFTAGAVAGTAGVIGLCAARRALRERKAASA
jgi:energy-converting hydrogenase Eha subunit G